MPSLLSDEKALTKPKVVEKTPMGLIQLKDRKSTDFVLVNPRVLDWINQPFAPPPGQRIGYDEEVPPSIREKYVELHERSTCHVSCGSFDNDRALAAMDMGKSFRSIASLIAYIQASNIEIVGEYEGHVY